MWTAATVQRRQTKTGRLPRTYVPVIVQQIRYCWSVWRTRLQIRSLYFFNLIKRCQQQRILFDFSEWFYLIRDLISDGVDRKSKNVKIYFMCDGGNNHRDIKSVSVNCKKDNSYVNIRTIKNTVFTLTKSEWLCCITFLPIFNKYMCGDNGTEYSSTEWSLITRLMIVCLTNL